jgi:GxxExxY protein
LGPGFVHRIYGNACYHEFRLCEIPAEPRSRFRVYFQGEPIGELRFDHFIVDGKIMLFPTVAADISRINIDNLKDWMTENGIRLGILANFLDTRIRPVFIVDTEFGESKH